MQSVFEEKYESGSQKRLILSNIIQQQRYGIYCQTFIFAIAHYTMEIHCKIDRIILHNRELTSINLKRLLYNV